ncbi:MAG TPA: type I pullulanase [Acholeplasma sp.]|nr:type I pullulanase [Acholeplasma sp.]
MNKMKKITLLLLLLFSSLVISSNIKAGETSPDLYFHYFRYDSAYIDWDSHIWKLGETGVNLNPVDETINGKTWGTTKIEGPVDLNDTYGIIIRSRGTWDGDREPGGDRFVKPSNGKLINGDYHFYIVQGDAVIYNEIPTTNHKILQATFLNDIQVKFTTTVAIPNLSSVKLYKGDVLAAVSAVTGTKNGYTFTTDTVDLSFTYRLEAVFGDQGAVASQSSVGFDGFYNSTFFESVYGYTGDDLGANYTKSKTTFKLWAPISEKITLNIYDNGHPTSVRVDGDDTPETHELTLGEKGVWSISINQDLKNKYYTYTVKNGNVINEVVDPYAVSSGVNALRGAVVDLESTNPNGWDNLELPKFSGRYVDSIIYELHVRDLTSHPSWGGPSHLVGKFLGVSESGTTYTKNNQTVSTGLDHMVDLGITHLHLLPAFEFGYVDETMLDDPAYFNKKDGGFNWGYMPTLFNVPEGSYSTNPYDGSVRVNEFKQMVQGLSNKGIRTVMDVVYNHTGDADYNFNKILPNYFFRLNAEGSLSNGSGTGNETASEHFMMRKFMVDSLKYWATEYNVKGFRFDLMALHDVETMNLIATELHKIDPTIIIYGEPWTGGSTPLQLNKQAGKSTMSQMPNIAAFNDVARNALRGSNNGGGAGWVQGKNEEYNTIKNVILGTRNTDYTFISPNQNVNYVSAHDNSTLADQIRLTSGGQTTNVRKLMQIQANALVLTAQGVPFIHAGAEIMRSKPDKSEVSDYNHNSYNASDKVNQINYNDKTSNQDVFKEYQELIKFRLDHPSFRLNTYAEVDSIVSILETTSPGVIAYRLQNKKDAYPDMIVIHNNGTSPMYSFPMPKGNDQTNFDGDLIWKIGYSNLAQSFNKAEIKPTENLNVSANETIIVYYGTNTNVEAQPDDNDTKENTPILALILIPAILVISVGAGIFFFIKKK